MNNPSFTDELAPYLDALERENNRKIKLIIHAGTPKTGTTSIQTYLHKKQRTLRGKGILYPHNLERLQNPTAPKHQWIEKNLITTHLSHLLENFKNIVSQIKHETHTVILSSEGIYNHWWDFPVESKNILAELSTLFEVAVWVWFREPTDFIESYYKQCIRNPQLPNNPCYGKDLSLAQMLDINWFARQLDYQGFVSECESLFGTNSMYLFNYEGDVVQQVINLLGVDTPHDNPTLQQNKSLNNASIEILRTVNKLGIKVKDKEALLPHLREINKILTSYDNHSLINEECRNKILRVSNPLLKAYNRA